MRRNASPCLEGVASSASTLGLGNLAFYPALVFRKEVFDRNVVRLLAGEEMLNVEVATRPGQTPLLYLFTPEVIIKFLPMLFVQLLYRRLLI